MPEGSRMGKREAELAREGWKKRTTYDEPRLSELVETYKEMGLEVRLEQPEPSEVEECSSCFGASVGKLKTIYTREKASKVKKAGKG